MQCACSICLATITSHLFFILSYTTNGVFEMRKLTLESLEGSTPKELRKLHSLQVDPLLKLNKFEMDAALYKLKTPNEVLSPIEYFFLADAIMKWYDKNKNKDFTREVAAKKMRISTNKFKLLSQAHNWPLMPRLYMITNSSHFSQTDMETYFRQSWRATKNKNQSFFDTRPCIATLKRHIEGVKNTIRRHKKKSAIKSSDSIRMEEKLRRTFMVRTKVDDSGTITLDCGNINQAYRVTEMMTAN